MPRTSIEQRLRDKEIAKLPKITQFFKPAPTQRARRAMTPARTLEVLDTLPTRTILSARDRAIVESQQTMPVASSSEISIFDSASVHGDVNLQTSSDTGSSMVADSALSIVPQPLQASPVSLPQIFFPNSPSEFSPQSSPSSFSSDHSQQLSLDSNSSLSDSDSLCDDLLASPPRPVLQRLRRRRDFVPEEQRVAPDNSGWIQRVIGTLKEYSAAINANESHPFKTLAAQWVSTGISYPEHGGSCELCDHSPITYHHEIVNLKTSQQLWIGSECIKKFAAEDLGLQQGDEIIRGPEAERRIEENVAEAQRKAEAARREVRKFFR